LRFSARRRHHFIFFAALLSFPVYFLRDFAAAAFDMQQRALSFHISLSDFMPFIL